MVDLCSVNDLDTSKLEEIYGKILDQTLKFFQPVWIDSSESDDPHIVLVDSLATENMDANELLLALDSLAVNVVTAHELLLSTLRKNKKRDNERLYSHRFRRSCDDLSV